jgi:hypothetical protein
MFPVVSPINDSLREAIRRFIKRREMKLRVQSNSWLVVCHREKWLAYTETSPQYRKKRMSDRFGGRKCQQKMFIMATEVDIW